MTQRSDSIQLHIAVTQRVTPFGDWVALCRCGWTGTPAERLEDARTDGDAHLAEANGWADDDTEVDFDTAEAAGLDGTGRDGDPRFPYTRRDVAEHLANRKA